MSAYQVSNEHISAILYWCDRKTKGFRGLLMSIVDTSDLQEVGQMMVDENIRNLRFLYEDRMEVDPIFQYTDQPTFAHRGKPQDVFQLLNCYAYQSCDRPEWNESGNKISRLVDALRCHVAQELKVIDNCETWSFECYMKRLKEEVA
ncbi:hypothetical protein VZG28_04900 [Synechococcus elongatus IITB4]|uniref:hypothetical protein n=1 Tax=Synechococcus elongatus TaxID=32046 RepID=UPI0030CCA3B4